MEEVFFRAFLCTAPGHSTLGAAGMVLFTSVVWAAIHVQYGFNEMLFILLFGVFIGCLRLKCRSIPPCLCMLSISSLAAMLEFTFQLE